jgi:hypothetical protein
MRKRMKLNPSFYVQYPYFPSEMITVGTDEQISIKVSNFDGFG